MTNKIKKIDEITKPKAVATIEFEMSFDRAAGSPLPSIPTVSKALTIDQTVPESPIRIGTIIPKIETMRQITQGFLQHVTFESAGEFGGSSLISR